MARRTASAAPGAGTRPGLASHAGQLRGTGIGAHVLASRVLAYGLARTAADGHLPPTAVVGDPAASLERALELFVADAFTDS